MKFVAPFDLGRYGDVLLNFMLGIMILFFPPGFLLPMMVALTFSLAFIFLYDHYRVLRCVPSFCFAGNLVDQIAHGMLALPCAIILACAILKSNQAIEHITGYRPLSGIMLLGFILGAMALHLTLHWWLLIYKVPTWVEDVEEEADVPYSALAKTTPSTWFSANPVHCLRSVHLHKHSPPCGFYFRGREHLLRANPALGSYFEDRSMHVAE